MGYVNNPYVDGGQVPIADYTPILPGKTNTAGGSLVPGLGGIGNPTGMNNVTGGIMNPLPIEGNMQMPLPTQTGGTGTTTPSTTVPGSGTPVSPTGTITGSNVGNLLGMNNPNIEGELNNLYGKGIGTALYQYLSGGAGYNPAVAQALLAQNKPLEEQGRANVLEAFGATGNRDSSSAALGLSNFESNFNLGQAGELANLYQNSVNNYQNLFGGVVNTAQLAEANKPTTLDTLGQIAGLLGGTGAGGGLAGLLKKLFGDGGLLRSGNAGDKPKDPTKNTSAIPNASNPSLNGGRQVPIDPSTQALLEGLGISPDAWTAVEQMFGGSNAPTDTSINSGIGDILNMFPTPSDPNLAGYGGSTNVNDTMPTGPQTTTSSLPDYIPLDGGTSGGDL